MTVSEAHVTPYPLWSLPADSLKRHPYIKDSETARAIVLFRENNPPAALTVESLVSAGIISVDNAPKLVKCAIAPAQ